VFKYLALLAAVFLFLFGGDTRSHTPDTHIANKHVHESSGISKSSRYAGVFWTHNDSGGKPSIYPLFLDGHDRAEYNKNRIKVKGAQNRDWEEIASYPGDRLVIGDFGNNANERKDLTLYIIPEPDPYEKKGKVQVEKRIVFHFEDQEAFPPKLRNFDCEAMFARGKDVYLLTKHRSDTDTKLYKVVGDTAVKLSTFPIGSKVTAADLSPDGKQAVVLSYDYLWLFVGENEDIFNGRSYRLPIALGQCEAVCFDGESVIVTNEAGEVFRIALTELLSHPFTAQGTRPAFSWRSSTAGGAVFEGDGSPRLF
jgi:hypothetical protein